MQPQDPQPTPTEQAAPGPGAAPMPAPAAPKTNTMAVIGLILAFFMPLIGLILSIVAKGQIKKSGEGGSGLATAGIIVSIINLVIQIIAIIFWVFVIGAAVVEESKNTSSNSSSTNTTSTVDSSSYSADEKKAVETSEAFLKALKNEDYQAMYNLMGPELKKEYSGVSDLQKQVEETGINISSWKFGEVTTNGSSDRINVQGDLTLNNNPSKGTFEFGYYKDTDASIEMYLWEVRPSY